MDKRNVPNGTQWHLTQVVECDTLPISATFSGSFYMSRIQSAVLFQGHIAHSFQVFQFS